MSNQRKTEECRDVIRIELPEGSNCQPLETDSKTMPKAACQLKEIIFCRTVYMWHRLRQLAKKTRVILKIYTSRRPIMWTRRLLGTVLSIFGLSLRTVLGVQLILIRARV